MKQLVEKHPISLFCVANFLTAILILVYFSFNATPQWAPGLFAIIIVAILEGKSGIRDILRNLLFRKKCLKWYLMAFALPILICGVSYIIISFIEYKRLVNVEFNHSPQDYIMFLFFVVLGSFGEEIGWRGFMLPQLLKRHSLFVSSLIIGLFWGIWHLNFQLGISVFAVYLLLVIDFSFITSWLYAKSKGNILTSVILHSSINMCSLVFFERIVVNPTNQHLLLMLYGVLTIIFTIPCLFVIRSTIISK